MLQSCYSHINVSTEQQKRQTQREIETHRKKEVEIAIQQKALSNKKKRLSSLNLTPSIPLDNPNSGRQIARVPLKLLTP